MRKKGLIVLAVIFLIILILNLVFTDRFFENRLESALSGVVGARVEFDDFYVSFVKLEAGWNSLRITDPNDTWENLIETGNARLDVEVTPLFYGRYVINDITLEGVRSGTERESDGKLPESENIVSPVPGIIDEAAGNISKKLEQNSGLDLDNLKGDIDLNSIVQTLDLQAPEKFNTFRDEITTVSARWDETWNSYPEFKTRSEELINKAGDIRIDGLRKINDFISAANTLKQLREDTRSLIDQIKQTQETFTGDYNSLKGSITSIDSWIADDITSAKAKAKLPDFNTENIAEILFGSQIIPKIEKAKKYYNIAHEYGSRLFPPNKVESPPRFQGQDIKFRNEKEWPLVWIKNISLSGETGSSPDDNSIALSGKITDIATDQKTTGKPTHIQLSGGKNTGEKIGITATLDLTGEDPIEEFIVDFAGIKMNTIELSENPLLPGSISNGSMDVSTSLNIRKGSLEGSLKALADGVEFVFPQEATTDRISGIVRDVFRELDKLDLDLGFSGSPDDINISMNSNLDKLLGSGLRSAAGDELMKAQTDLENKVKERIEPEKQRLMAFYNSKLGDLDSKITQLDAITGSNNQLIESKKQELEKRIDSEKNPLLKQALKAVKQIIKW